MARTRAGTSAINRRKFVAKAKAAKEPTASTTTTTTTSTRTSNTVQPKVVRPSRPAERVVDGSNTVASQGLVVAPPGAQNIKDGSRPKSSQITGEAIKVDDEGRMDLTEIAKMDVFSATARGAVVPTEQMVGVVKDVAYGVASEDQSTMESGLDLLLNPIMKPFVDPRMETEGVISEKWYYPEELKVGWKVLPAFMQKGSGEGYTPETRSFIEGASANVGNIGAIAQSPLAQQIAADEGDESWKRFNTSSGTQAYYIGSALGEIPYFIIGAGQIKAVGTIAAKATAGTIRGTNFASTTGARVIATAYKIERATDKLQKISNRANVKISQSEIISRPEVLRAVKLLKDGYAMNVKVQTKTKGLGPDEGELAKTISRKMKYDSKSLNKFSAKKMDEIEGLPERTNKQKLRKKIKIDEFNADVQETLLPDMRKFKDGYIAQAQKTAKNGRVEKVAQMIEGSPGNMSKKMDDYFYKRRDDMGDAATSNEKFLRSELEPKIARGEFSGVMGAIKFDRYLFGNTMKSALGVNRTQKKAANIIQMVQRAIPSVRAVTKDELIGGNEKLRELVKSKKKENKEIDKLTDAQLEKKGIEKGTYNENLKLIEGAERTIKINEDEALKNLSFTRTKKYATKDTPRYRYDFGEMARIYGAKTESIMPENILMASKPSVSVKRVRGKWEGQIGDDLSTSKTFFVDQIARSKAMEIYGPDFVSKDPSIWKSIGTRRVGRYRTLIPRKAEPMEDIVYMYEASDSLRAAGRGKSGVKPVVIIDDATTPFERAAMKKKYGLGTFTSDPKVEKAIGADDKIVLEYKPIGGDMISDVKQGNQPRLDGQDVTDILINRAELENRPAEFDFFAEIKTKNIKKELSELPNVRDAELERVAANTKGRGSAYESKSQSNVIAKYELQELGLKGRLKELDAKMGSDFSKTRKQNIKVSTHTTADQRGMVVSMPMEVLKRSSDNYALKYSTNMQLDKKTGKQYYLSGDDWFEITDKRFRPSMVSNTTEKRKVFHSTKETDYLSNTGLGGSLPFSPTKEAVTIDVMQKGTSQTWRGTIGWSKDKSKITKKNPKGWTKDAGEFKTEYSDDFQMGLDALGKGEAPKQSSQWEKIFDADIAEPGSGPRPSDGGQGGRASKYNKSGRDFLDNINDATRENLIFLDDASTYKDMIKKVSKADVKILESGSIIGTRQSRTSIAMAAKSQSDPEQFVAGGRKLTAEEKKTGKLIPEGTTFTVDYGKKSKTQLVDENLNIVKAKGILKVLEGAADTRKKLKSKVFGERFVPLEVRDLTPDISTYRGLTGSQIERIPYGDAIRMSYSDDGLARLFGTSQSRYVTQPTVPGGVKVTPIQTAYSTSHFVKEMPFSAGQANPGKGLSANKQTNYEKMLFQAESQGDDVVREFKTRVVEQVYSKIKKQKKPDSNTMELFLQPNSVQYKNLVDLISTRRNQNLKVLNRREALRLKVRNKGRRNKKSIINPKDFEDVIGTVSIDRRNPIQRANDAFRLKTQERTQAETFTSGTNYTVDGKVRSNYHPTKTDAGTSTSQANWLERLAIRVGEKRKNNYQVTEEDPVTMRAVKEVMQEDWAKAFIGTDKTFTKLDSAIQGRGQTQFEGSLEVIWKNESADNVSRNASLKELLTKTLERQSTIDKEKNPGKWKNAQYQVDEVKNAMLDNDPDLARQGLGSLSDTGMDMRSFGIKQRTGIFKKDTPPRDRWADNRRTADDDNVPQDAYWNVSKNTYGPNKERVRLAQDQSENTVPGWIPGQPPRSTVSRKNYTLSQEKSAVRLFLMESVGIASDVTTSSSRRSLGKNIVDFMEESFEKSTQKKNKNMVNAGNPIKNLSEYLDQPGTQKKLDTPEFRAAEARLVSQQTMKPMSKKVEERVTGNIPVKGMVMGLPEEQLLLKMRSGEKTKPVGIAQQVPLGSSLATTVGNLFKPSDTIASEQEPLELPSFALGGQAYAQEPNAVEQTVGDIKRTLTGIEIGNERIVQGGVNEVKTYEAPAGLINIIGRMDMSRSNIQSSSNQLLGDMFGSLDSSRSDIQTSIGQRQGGLLDGLQLNPTIQAIGNVTVPKMDQFIGGMQEQTQRHVQGVNFALMMKPQAKLDSIPIAPIVPKPIPQRVMPFAPVFPLYDPRDPKKRPRRTYGKNKKKKTWWQTPENWYEPYYWGGKNQEGQGYVTFTGKEPAKVKKYEKKFFGIGVNDSPFGVRSKWF